MRSIDTHALGYGLLAKPSGEAVTAHVCAHELADFHPQGGQQSRILVLRIKIRDTFGGGLTAGSRAWYAVCKKSHLPNISQRYDDRDRPRTVMTGTKMQLADAPPASEHVTDYDRGHVKTYLRLLDAAADDADWREVADLVLGLDVRSDPDYARQVHDAHLARAKWMTTSGYRDLLTGSA